MDIYPPSARFLSPLRTEKIGEQRWLLIDDLVFRSEKYKGIFIAPRGAQTDLASIPLIAQSLFSKVGNYDRSAVIHDGGYGNYLVTENGDRIFCIKRVSDDLFNEGMAADDVSRVKRFFIYHAVKYFGNPDGHPLAMNRI